ncbi:MAG: hypothetical protein RL885_28430 [Planctomycetota bacterium]
MPRFRPGPEAARAASPSSQMVSETVPGASKRSGELVRIRLHGERCLKAAGAAAASVAGNLGFVDEDRSRVESVVLGLCREVVEHHFDSPSDADFTLILSERPGGLDIRIEDRGLPYPADEFSLGRETLIGRLHARGEVDSLRFESRGLEGNNIQVGFSPSARQQKHLADQSAVDTDPVPVDAHVSVRPFKPKDAPAIARCAYRCYGYTYANDFIYYPDQLRSLIERNLLQSLVGVNEHDEVVGHYGLFREHDDSRVAETGLAFVDPRYRNHHLLHTLKEAVNSTIESLGLVATFADAVAVHEITQKANVKTGAVETGLLLAEIPAFTTFCGFDQEPRQRGTVVLYFHVIGNVPRRTVHLPACYRDLLTGIYDRLGLDRSLAESSTDGPADRTSLHVEIKSRRGLARIEVERAGRDIVSEVTRAFEALCQERFDVIHLDLDLGDPAQMAAVDAMRELGFFFGGLIPELWQTDVLRLQFLNELELDTSRIILYSDEAKALLQFLEQERAR